MLLVGSQMDDDGTPLDNAIEWCRDARDAFVAAGEMGPAKMVAAAMILLTRARVATCGAVPDLIAAG